MKEEPKKTTYRVEEQKVFEMNRKHRERRERALIIKEISFGLFGRRRYRNFYLECSLNNFFDALTLANILQRRVEGLAMVVRFEKVNYQLFEDGSDKCEDKDYSIFRIKLTRSPSEADKADPGYNPAFNKADLEEPITE